MSVADFIDNSPMGKLFTAVVMEGPGKLMGAVGKVLDGAAGVFDSAVAGVGNAIGSVKDMVPSMSMGASEHAPEVARVREPEISAPAHAHHVDMADLGHFSAPTFGSGPVSQGIGRG